MLSGCASIRHNVGTAVTSTASAVGSAASTVGSTAMAVGSKVGSTAMAVGSTVGSTALAVGSTVGSSAIAVGSTVGSTVTDTVNSTIDAVASTTAVANSTTAETADTVTETVESTVNESAVWVGETTGSSTLVKAGAQMTPRESYYLGRICAAKVLATREAVSEEELAAYINTLGQYLAMHSQTPELYKGYQFVLIRGDTPNAVSTPGGFVFITTGMLFLVESEDELASVLAHEIAHISLHHAEEAIQTANRLDVFGGAIFKTASQVADFAAEKSGLENIKLVNDLKILKVFKVFDAVTDLVLNIGFNQPQEMAADREAMKILKAAGYQQGALGTILSKLTDDSTFVGLHPGGPERIRAVDKRNIASEPRSDIAAEKIRKRFLHFKSLLRPVDVVNDRY
jgi:predicted Zn-dependent protease